MVTSLYIDVEPGPLVDKRVFQAQSALKQVASDNLAELSLDNRGTS